MARTRQRWLPALLIPLALAIAILLGSVQAGATVSLPPKTAEEILAMIARSEVRALSGTVEQTAELGLPELPTSGPGIAPGAASALEFLTGSHTARVYVDGPLRLRLQVLDQMAERDVVINGGDVWFYNSRDNSATHLTAPDKPTPPDMPAPHMTPSDMPTPEAMAGRFLEAVDAGTEVTTAESSSVAGRSAYSLVLNPRSTETLVDSVTIDVDSETGLPLGVEVRANGQTEPAYSLEYTQLDLSRPGAELFDFTPPPGATVTEKKLPAKPSMIPTVPTPDMRDHGASVTGKGWDSVISLPAGSAPAEFTSNPQLSQALQPVGGGRALTTALLSVLILDDGRIYAGMVPLERLQSAAAAQ
ncbi:outer membrane lipoprotein carrier protein LolA [Paenarthrobacter sp.]|uniref:LolA family protein n=1 Tax=Paenarthrobacter sp. TaxID=1931993 RepID=UPI0028124C00|nr:outer membrane lipoprotein carrier protein LolA [Paenarthrobacter sp.]